MPGKNEKITVNNKLNVSKKYASLNPYCSTISYSKKLMFVVKHECIQNIMVFAS